MKKSDVEFIKLLGLTASIRILELLEGTEKAHYSEMSSAINSRTLYLRLSQFMNLGLIKHHFIREEKREEWYEITERGRKALQKAMELVSVLEE